MAILIFAGTWIGFLAGRGYQVAHRAWADYKKTQALVPQMQKAFWAAARASIVVVMLALAWMAGSVAVAATDGPPATTSPSPQAR